MEEPIIRVTSSQILNLGYDLRRRLDAVAAREQIHPVTLGRRIVDAAVTAREQAQGVREGGHE
jgi:hypothetical protein